MSKDGRKMALKMMIAQARNQIKDAKEVSKGNISYMKYIEGFHLMVEVDGKEVPVNSKTVCFYEENQMLVKARIDDLESKISSYEQELKELAK